ncbi:hypothetical protein DVH24_008661 [Malus domestica]|uniref:Cytochrome P450 n=1 Tax=Malus domestica TaxID=3750 RepID=A0A498JSE4_MALDO|nr:hypothetical protein DVH24_008661 [Malus domestica]
MVSQLLLFVFLIPFIFLLLVKHKRKSNASQARRLPPGLRRMPLIGNLHKLSNGSLLHHTLERLAAKYGDLMFLQLGSVSTLVVSSSHIAKEIFKTHDLAFSSRPALYTPKKLSYDSADLIISPYEEYWREVKKIVILKLLSANRIKMFQSVRDEEVGLMLESIEYFKSPVNISELTLFLTNNVLCCSAFGKKYDDGGEIGKSKIPELLEETRALLGRFCMSDFLPWISLDNLYDRVIEEHLDPKRLKPEYEDLVDVLFRVQKDPNQTIALTKDQIKGVLIDMFIAGTDTSAATLVWTMVELIRNPRILRKAQDEVREVLKGKRKVEETDLSKLVYLKLVLKKSFRLHPSAPLLVPRETLEICTIEGYEIPANTMVFVHAKMIGNDLKCWENPKEFLPERSMDSSVDYKGNHFELLPFGAGMRGCPGINFGVKLIELALANLLYCFDWELPHGVRREDLDMEEAAGITIGKKKLR